MSILRRARLRSAARIFSVTAAMSALVGVVWGLLAPAEHLLVVSSDRGVALTAESRHQFDSIGIFACAGLVVGILAAVATWTARRTRGPVAVGALLAGSLVGSSLMALTGLGVAWLRFPKADQPAVGSIVGLAPGIGAPMVLIVQPLAACVITLVLAALSPYDDLGVSDFHDEDEDEHAEDGELDHDDDAGQPVQGRSCARPTTGSERTS